MVCVDVVDKAVELERLGIAGCVVVCCGVEEAVSVRSLV